MGTLEAILGLAGVFFALVGFVVGGVALIVVVGQAGLWFLSFVVGLFFLGLLCFVVSWLLFRWRESS